MAVVGEKKDEPSSGLKMVAVQLWQQFYGNDNKRRRWWFFGKTKRRRREESEFELNLKHAQTHVILQNIWLDFFFLTIVLIFRTKILILFILFNPPQSHKH